MRANVPFFDPLLSNLRKLRGFTVVEVTIAVCAIVILSAITIIRVGEVRDAALDAQSKADASALQLAYDRAVNYQLDILTNDSVLVFATNAYEWALISQIPSANSLSKIFLAPGSHITNDTAAFITRTNTSNQPVPPPTVAFISPTSGQTFLAGQNITLSVTVSSSEYISQVVFFDNGTTVGAAAVAPYNLTITTPEGPHIFSAIATSESGQTGTNQVAATVNPNVPPLVYLYQPTAGSYPYTASLTLQAVASDPNAGGGITKLSIFAGSNQIATTSAGTYSGTWTGPPGIYSFVAKAWDVGNAMTVSAPVAVTLLALNPPTVTLNSPSDGQSFVSPTTVPLRVTASADGGPVAQVQYVITSGPTFTVTSFPFSYDWVNPSAGNYSIQAFAYDNSGARGQSASSSITVTQDAPPAVGLIPTNGSSFITPITISVTATATSSSSTVTNVSILINGNAVSSSSSSYTYSWVNPYAGTYTVCAVATDSHGVTASSATNQVTIAQDQPPSVVLTNPTNGATYLTPVTVQLAATATDPDDGVAYVDFVVDGQTIATVTQSPYTFNWVNPISGSHTIQAVAYDYHTLSTASSTISVLVNQDPPPGVTLTSPPTETVLTPTNIVLSATASVSELNVGGSIAGVGFYTNGVLYANITGTPYNSTLYLPLTGAGTYTIQAVAMDNLGVTNGSLISTVTAAQDQPPSSVALTSPANGMSYLTPTSVTLTATASDPDDGVARVDFMDGSSVIVSSYAAPYAFSWANPGTGTHSLAAVAYDSKGLSLTSAVVSITVTADVAPQINLTGPADGGNYLNPTNVVMTATASSELSSISKVTFYVDSSAFATVYSAPYTTTWTNPAYGTHVIYAAATDSLGLSTSTTNVTIQAGTNYPPTIVWVTPTNGLSLIVPANLALQVAATDPQNEVTLVTITDQYGDRLYMSTSPAGPYSNTWAAGVGTYNLAATVYDQHGASDSSTIQVTGIQSQAPSVALISPTSGASYTAPASVTITASANDAQTGNGVSKVELYANGTLIASANSDTITTNWTAGEGSYAITAKACDNFNASQVSAPVSVTVNGPVAPVVVLNSPANGTILTNLDDGGASVNMGVTITDSNSGFLISTIVFYDGSTQLTETTGATNFTDTTLANGSHSLWAKVTDSYSQVGCSQTNSITIQAVASGNLEAPSVTISSSVASGTIVPTGTPITLTATAVNNGNGGSIADVQIMVNGSSVATLTSAPYTYVWTPVSAATNTIEAVAYTALNVPGASTNISLISFVNQAPTVALVTPVANQTFLGPTTVAFQARASGFYGAIQRVDFTANGSVVGSAATATGGYYTFAWSNCTVGSYPVYAAAYDVYGAHTNTTPITINVSQLQPPTSVAITSPSSGANLPTPYNVVISATAVDDADGIASVTLLTNGVPLTTLTVSPYSYTWVNPPAAGYNLAAIAQNNGGLTLTSAVVSVTISTATAPAVAWTSPSPASGTYRYNYPFTWEVTPSDQFTPQSALNVAIYDNSNYVATVNQGNSWTMTGYIPTAGATHYMTAWTTNESGIAGSSPTLTIVMETNNPPTIVLNSPTNGATEALNRSVTLQATASDPDLDPVIVVFYVDGTPIITNTTPSGSVFTSSTTFGIGSHTVSAMAVSYGFSNPGIPSLTNTINAIHMAPQIALYSPTNGSSFALNSPVSLSFSAQPQDGTSIASVSQSVDGTSCGSSTTQNGLTNSTSTLPAGSHSYAAVATDTYGYSMTNSTTFSVTHMIPSIVFTSPTNGSAFVQYVPVLSGFYATAHDGTAITNTQLYSDATLTASNSFAGQTNTSGTLTVGNHTNTAIAIDSNGTRATNTVTFSVTAYTPPQITLTPANGSLTAFGSNTTITATAVDRAGQSITAMALCIDGVQIAANAGSPVSYATNFPIGAHAFYATATDLSGSTNSATNTINAAVLTPPSITFTNYNGFAVRSSVYQDGMPLIAVVTPTLRPITNVSLYDDGTFLGGGTTNAFGSASTSSNWYAFNWQSAAVGSHSITAVATDSLGISASNQLSITAEPGYYQIMGGTVGLPAGTIWSYFGCPLASATPSSSKAAMSWYNAGVGNWVYAGSSSYTPQLANGGSYVIPDVANDSLLAFNPPQSGTITLNGVASIASGAGDGVRIKIWNGTAQVYPSSGWTTVGNNQSLMIGTSMTVTAGTPVYVQVNCGAADNTTGDYLNFPFTVAYTSGSFSAPNLNPITGLTSGQQYVVNQPYSLSVTATDPNSGGEIIQTSLQVDGSALNTVYNTGTCPATWTPTTQGSHTITATAYDNYGLAATNSITVYGPPTVNIGYPTSGLILASGSVTVTATVSDQNSGGTITDVGLYQGSSRLGTMTGGAPYSYTWVGAALGSNTVTVQATDSYGAVKKASVSFIFDTGPTVTFSPGISGTNLGGTTFYVSVTVGGPFSMTNVVYKTNGVLAAQMTTFNSVPITPTTGGAYTLAATVSDTYGATGSVTNTFTVGNPPIPAITSPANGAQVAAGTVAVTGTATQKYSGDPPTQMSFYTNGTLLAAVAGSGPYSTSFTAATGQSYNISATGTDSYGYTSTNSTTVGVSTAVPNWVVLHAGAAYSITGGSITDSGSIEARSSYTDAYNFTNTFTIGMTPGNLRMGLGITSSATSETSGPAYYPYGFYFNLNGQSALAALYNGSSTSLTGWFTSTVSKGDVFAIRVHNGSLTFVYNGTIEYTYGTSLGSTGYYGYYMSWDSTSDSVTCTQNP